VLSFWAALSAFRKSSYAFAKDMRPDPYDLSRFLIGRMMPSGRNMLMPQQ